ncbi:MAG: TIGR04255 family protein [Thermomicrobiales bacterium]
MSLNFPDYRDIPLVKSPLTEVICQVRFPAILRIGTSEPVDFQEAIRARFPMLEIEQGFILRLPGMGTREPAVTEPSSRVYRFRTADDHSSVSLGTDFYSLSTDMYTVWKHFASDLRLIHRAMRQTYRISFATRIGLRYVNRITPANAVGVAPDDLPDLLRPELASLIRTSAWSEPNELLSQVILKDGSHGNLALRVGFRRQEEEGPEILLDFDYYEEGELELNRIDARCARYHDRIYQAFRWCIRDDRLEVFEPRRKGDA